MQSAGEMCPLAKFVLQFARAEREISGAVAYNGELGNEDRLARGAHPESGMQSRSGRDATRGL